MGIPCKHRIQIVKGYCDGIVEAPENYQEIISAIREALAGTDFKKILDKYTDRKNTEKAVNANSERLFKKYRDAIIAKALGKGTDKATQKALEDLNGAIQECVDVSAETEGLIMSLRGIFVRPEGPDSTTMAKEALGEE
jgi:hypothetical protein